ncbi:MAG: glycosyl hydrolase family 17, partial [Cyclobacteriaceae bacterium]
MKWTPKLLIATFVWGLSIGCSQPKQEKNSESNLEEVTAKDILGNPAYQAISYGGYREQTREVQPT